MLPFVLNDEVNTIDNEPIIIPSVVGTSLTRFRFVDCSSLIDSYELRRLNQLTYSPHLSHIQISTTLSSNLHITV